MTKYTGKGVYGAVAMGKISVFKKQDTAIKRIHTEDSEGEKKRVAKAKQAARNSFRQKTARLRRRQKIWSALMNYMISSYIIC